MTVLSSRDLEFFDENGYVIALQVISREQTEDNARALWHLQKRIQMIPTAGTRNGPAGPDGLGAGGDLWD